MIVFDLDNTLRNTDCAYDLMPRGNAATYNPNWNKWQMHVNKHGTPIPSIVDLFRKLSPNQFVAVVTSSGFGSQGWLTRHDLYPDIVVERDQHDHRYPVEYKTDYIDEWYAQITLWVDDCKEVCRYAESKGIPTVLVTKKMREL